MNRKDLTDVIKPYSRDCIKQKVLLFSEDFKEAFQDDQLGPKHHYSRPAGTIPVNFKYQTPTQSLKNGFFAGQFLGNWFEFGIIFNDF